MGVIGCERHARTIGLVGTVLFFLAALPGCDSDSAWTQIQKKRTGELAQFGVAEGKINTLQVAGVTFRFPADYHIDPKAFGKIEIGHADSVEFLLNYSKAVEEHQAVVSPDQREREKRQVVRIKIQGGGGEDPKRRAVEPDALTNHGWSHEWKEVGEQWGLQVFRPPLYKMGISSTLATHTDVAYYKSIEGKTPKGSPWAFNCWGTAGYVCKTSFDHPIGVGVEIMSDETELPQWQFIVRAVLSTIDSLAVVRTSG